MPRICQIFPKEQNFYSARERMYNSFESRFLLIKLEYFLIFICFFKFSMSFLNIKSCKIFEKLKFE